MLDTIILTFREVQLQLVSCVARSLNPIRGGYLRNATLPVNSTHVVAVKGLPFRFQWVNRTDDRPQAMVDAAAALRVTNDVWGAPVQSSGESQAKGPVGRRRCNSWLFNPLTSPTRTPGEPLSNPHPLTPSDSLRYLAEPLFSNPFSWECQLVPISGRHR